MRQLLGRLIMWGLFGTVAVILMAGCARYTQPDRTIELPLADRRALAREMLGLTQEPEIPTLRMSGENTVTEFWCAYCCPDQRWGKCEEHGEWWTLAGRDKGPLKGVYGSTKADRWKWLAILICPGDGGHYIEREIEGPGEKP